MIGIDEKEVVGLIDPDLLSHNMAQQRFVQPVVSHVGMNHTGLKLATWVIAIVFVGLLLVWWLDRDDGLDERIPLNSEGTTRMAESVEGVSDLAEPVTAQPQPEKHHRVQILLSLSRPLPSRRDQPKALNLLRQ